MPQAKYKIGDRVAVYLPDGSLLNAKILKIIPGAKSNCYLVQYNGTNALVTGRDIIQKM